MKTTKRLICLVLALLMLVPLVVACKKSGDDGKPTETGAADVTDANSEVLSDESAGPVIEYDENGYQKDRLGKQDFGGKEIRILAWEGSAYEEFDMEYEDIDSSVLGQEVYNRNVKVEARMNVKLVFTRCPGYNQVYAAEYIPKAEAMVTDNAVDAFACYSMAATPLMVRGYLKDMKDYSAIDLTAPWWSQELIGRASLYDRLYFATGSISPSLLGQGWTILFNKTMAGTYLNDKLDEFGAESLYDMVKEGTWTIDNFIALVKTVEISGDTKTDDETYGLVLNGVPAYDPFFFASGLKTLDNAADGSLQASEEWGSAKTIELADKLLNLFKSKSAGEAIDHKVGNDQRKYDYHKAWTNGTSLFVVGVLGDLANYKQKHPVGEKGIGVLPMPKWDSTQEKYLSTAGFPFTLWSITRASDRQDATAATIECLASEGYRLTEPALYDNVLKIQSVEGAGFAEDQEMIDLVRDSIVIDAGRLHNNDIGHLGYQMFRWSLQNDICTSAPNSAYASRYAELASSVEASLVKINSSVSAFESVYGD